jgi:hypothetical protein
VLFQVRHEVHGAFFGEEQPGAFDGDDAGGAGDGVATAAGARLPAAVCRWALSSVSCITLAFLEDALLLIDRLSVYSKQTDSRFADDL